MDIKFNDSAYLIRCDCLEALPLIQCLYGAVDMALTDPAYKVISGGNKNPKAPTGILDSNDGKIFQHNNIKIAQWLPLIFDTLKDPSHAYFMTNFLNLETIMRVSKEAGFRLHNLCVWGKNNVTPNRWYMKNVEYTLFVRKGAAFPINDKGAKTLVNFDNIRNKLHPTQKPVELMEHYILNSTKPGDIVLDPFMGSGTTGVACMNTGRKFVGIELDPEYFNIACDRIGVSR